MHAPNPLRTCMRAHTGVRTPRHSRAAPCAYAGAPCAGASRAARTVALVRRRPLRPAGLRRGHLERAAQWRALLAVGEAAPKDGLAETVVEGGQVGALTSARVSYHEVSFFSDVLSPTATGLHDLTAHRYSHGFTTLHARARGSPRMPTCATHTLQRRAERQSERAGAAPGCRRGASRRAAPLEGLAPRPGTVTVCDENPSAPSEQRATAHVTWAARA